jgi:hypothetical protein
VEEHIASKMVADELEDLYRGLEIARAQLVNGEVVKAITILGRVSPRFERLVKLTTVVAGGNERALAPANIKTEGAGLIPANEGAVIVSLKKSG